MSESYLRYYRQHNHCYNHEENGYLALRNILNNGEDLNHFKLHTLTYNEIKRLKEAINWARIAALLDGEGQIGLQQLPSKLYKTVTYNCNISISNTNKDILDWIENTIKLGKVKDRVQQKENWKTCHRWRLEINEMEYFLNQIIQYLIIKQKQAKWMLIWLKEFKDYSPKTPPLEVQQRRQFIYEQLKRLNERGV